MIQATARTPAKQTTTRGKPEHNIFPQKLAARCGLAKLRALRAWQSLFGACGIELAAIRNVRGTQSARGSRRRRAIMTQT